MFLHQLPHVDIFQTGDKQQRLDYVNEFLIRYENDDSWLLRILWMDVALFLLTLIQKIARTG